MDHSIQVGQKFGDYRVFESTVERYQSAESVPFYKKKKKMV